MAQPQSAPYGSWRSPVTSELIVTGTVGLEQVRLDGPDIYWIETRPMEQGRHVVVRRAPDGTVSDCTPPPFNARTRVHEYGGASYAVHAGTIYFSNFADQRLYRQDPGKDPWPLTPAGDLRYADAAMDARRGRLVCVREEHSGQEQPVNCLAGIDAQSGAAQVLVSGNDFYAAPRVSPDGTRLTWLTWNHPNMPWDGTELWVADLSDDGALVGSRCVAGGLGESIFQPEWSPDGSLYFVSDRSGWWNLYRWRDDRGEPLAPQEAEFGRPLWLLGLSTYAFESASRIICAFTVRGTWCLASVDTRTGCLERLETPYTDVRFIQAAPGRALFVGGAPTESVAVVQLDIGSGRPTVLRRSSPVTVPAGYLSTPEAIEFPTTDNQTAHAFFYHPRNPDFTGLPGERPPLLVISHGGPTSATVSTLRLDIQYWTSRGFAVLDVNYGGSTGYGRAYRERLNDRWGIVDVDDCVSGAAYLIEKGEADPRRLAIRGGSAGGYTTLAALTFRDRFRAGASHYGVSDLEALAKDTHKFESRYLDRLIGPYPQRQDLYRQRSPIHFTERLSCPVILFQGLEDKVVPPSQAELMRDALRAKGLPVAYVPFAGEQHGFRRAENIKRALEGELYFYGRVFGFAPADPVEPVPIDNLP
jgi:dipeptidyl aminopeptidase/acylaminoacyl peptidase